MTAKNSLQEWLDQLEKDDVQLELDFDTMDTQPSGLTISSTSNDTITLGSGASGTTYDFNYNDTISLTGAAGSPYTFPATNITISNTTGGYGQILTTGTNGLNWSDIPNPGLKVNGNAEFDGDVKIKGKSITEMFDKIEERLAILHPNEKLEEKWEELKELGKRYKELEKEIIEKEKMWDILKR
jgi:hypothetical protein